MSLKHFYQMQQEACRRRFELSACIQESMDFNIASLHFLPILFLRKLILKAPSSIGRGRLLLLYPVR